MLASLLPGFRQLRAPVSAGAISLIVVWLIVGGDHLIPEASSGNALESRLAGLADLVGRSGVAALMTAAAYLVGTFLTVSSRPFLKIVPVPMYARGRSASWTQELYSWANRVSWRLSVDRDGLHYASIREDETGTVPASFVRFVYERWSSDLLRNSEPQRRGVSMTAEHDGSNALLGASLEGTDPIWFGPIPEHIVSEALARHVCDDGLPMLTELMRAERSDLWNVYDQHRAEAELRYSLVLPLCVLTAVLITLGGAPYALGFLAPISLLLWAQRLEKQSLRIVGVALNAGFVKSPLATYLDEFHTAEPLSNRQIVVRGVVGLPWIARVRQIIFGWRLRIIGYFERRLELDL